MGCLLLEIAEIMHDQILLGREVKGILRAEIFTHVIYYTGRIIL